MDAPYRYCYYYVKCSRFQPIAIVIIVIEMIVIKNIVTFVLNNSSLDIDVTIAISRYGCWNFSYSRETLMVH